MVHGPDERVWKLAKLILFPQDTARPTGAAVSKPRNSLVLAVYFGTSTELTTWITPLD